MSQRAVIIQSNYIPWKGYFDLLAHADLVVFLDSVQSTKNDWRNRNQIKTQSGKRWLTIPIRHSNALRIREVEIAQCGWGRKHFLTLAQAYARAPHASSMLPWIEDIYMETASLRYLSAINRAFIRKICGLLSIETRVIELEDILDDREHDALDPTQRLTEICRKTGATSYLSGPAAGAYLDEKAFAEAGITLEWFHYEHYPEYQQLHGSFDHRVSVLDLLLMVGPEARQYSIRTIPKFLQRSIA
jgi:hypothetical protein